MPVTLLSFQEASRRYRVPLRRLQRLIRDGRIKTVRLGGEELVPDEDVAMIVGQPQTVDRWIPLAEAIALHPEVDEAILRKLVKEGAIASKMPPDASEEMVDGHELAEMTKQLDRGQWDHLEGQAISVREASRKYGLRSPSLSRWAQKGHIRVLTVDGYWTYLDESDVRFAAALAAIAGKRGKALSPQS